MALCCCPAPDSAGQLTPSLLMYPLTRMTGHFKLFPYANFLLTRTEFFVAGVFLVKAQGHWQTVF
jgi:hypothetical protein